jgi:hypothetical protein
MTSKEGGPEDRTAEVKARSESPSITDEIAEKILRFVSWNCGTHPPEVLGAALKLASTRWDHPVPKTLPQEGDMDEGVRERDSSESVSGGAESGLPPRSISALEGVLYQDAAVWVFISAFIGLAAAWGSGMMAPWIGALIAGGLTYLGAAVAMASRG